MDMRLCRPAHQQKEPAEWRVPVIARARAHSTLIQKTRGVLAFASRRSTSYIQQPVHPPTPSPRHTPLPVVRAQLAPHPLPVPSHCSLTPTSFPPPRLAPVDQPGTHYL